MENLIEQIEKYSKKYDISFDFNDNYNSFWISKNGIHLKDEGGFETVKETFEAALKYLNKINPKI